MTTKNGQAKIIVPLGQDPSIFQNKIVHGNEKKRESTNLELSYKTCFCDDMCHVCDTHHMSVVTRHISHHPFYIIRNSIIPYHSWYKYIWYLHFQ